MNLKEIEEYRNSFSDDQINEIANSYDKGEKVTNIISAYNLDISPGQLVRFLPMIETETECPYCRKKMVRPRTRDSYISKNRIRCKLCGHKLGNKCECLNCCAEKEKQEIAKKEMIRDYYYNLQLDYEEIEFQELNLEERFYLYMLYVLDGNSRNLKTISRNLRRSGIRNKLISKLIELRIILVSPNSDIDAFSEDDFPRWVYIERANYVVNVRFSSEDESMICRREFSLKGIDEKEIIELFHKIMYEDILEYFQSVLAKRNIELKATEKQKTDLQLLFNKLSYTQIKNLCLRVAKYYCDGIVTGKFYKGKVGGQALASVVTFYNNSILKGWSIYKSNAQYTGVLLKNFIINVLQCDISILDEVIELK